MENISSSEDSTISLTNNIERVNGLDQSCKESPDVQHGSKDSVKQELLLDLRNLSATCGDNMENDNSSAEYSMTTEQPIGQSSIADLNSVSQRDNEDTDTNLALQARIRSLQEIMGDLKETLQQEVSLWKKERDEFQVLREKSDVWALEEATAAARAAAAAYAAESPLSNDLGEVLDITSEETLRELTILEYEKKLAKYQDEFSLNQAEKRYNTRWQMVAQAYKQKLVEVERLCNEELEKVRRNADHLQELKDMTSQWYYANNSRGDTIDNFGRIERDKIITEDAFSIYRNYRKLDTDMNMSEIYSARYKSDDILKQDFVYGHI